MDFQDLIKKVKNFGKSELIYWSNAIAGEAGEFCNLVKKRYRDDDYSISAMREELADIVIYVILTARDVLEIDLEQAILDKLAKIERKRGRE
jgi:NTP pyrophosphatase (non-canonical NTP hydrolase)